MEPNPPIRPSAMAMAHGPCATPMDRAEAPRPRKNTAIMPTVLQRSPSQPAAGASRP